MSKKNLLSMVAALGFAGVLGAAVFAQDQTPAPSAPAATQDQGKMDQGGEKKEMKHKKHHKKMEKKMKHHKKMKKDEKADTGATTPAPAPAPAAPANP